MDLPISLVCAPPGTGKTALVSAWAESCGRPVAWLTLDAGDVDPARLLTHLVAAVREAVPGACPGASAALKKWEPGEESALAEAFADELDSTEAPFVLVLDQFEQVGGGLLPELVKAILDCPPVLMHLVIVARREPALPLQALRGRGQLRELRQRDLSLSLEETELLLSQCLDRKVDPEEAAAAHERFEGWLAGLHLFAVAQGRRSPEDSLLQALPTSSPEIDGYLLTEVFDRQPAEMQDHLLRCSILDRFTADLCDAVAAPRPGALSGAAFLERAWEQRLFLLRHEGEARWSRFTHPFREFLQAQFIERVVEDEVRECHARAAEWFGRQGYLMEAVDHSLRAGDPNGAARMVGEHRIEWTNAGRLGELLEAASRLPEEAMDSHLDTRLLQVWITPPALFPDAVAKVESKLAGEAPPKKRADAVRGELRLMQAGSRVAQSLEDPAQLPEMIAMAEEAISLLPVEFRVGRAMATHLLAHARQSNGDLPGAMAAIDAGLVEHGNAGGEALSIVLFAACIVHEAEANLVATRDAAIRCVASLPEGAPEGGLVDQARRLLGVVHYQWNELDVAEEVLRRCARDLSANPLRLARVLQAQGHSSEADRLVAESLQLCNPRDPADLLHARAHEALIALLQGRMEPALRWAEGTRTEKVRPLMNAINANLIRAQILIASGTDRNRATASELLGLLREVGETWHRKKLKIEVLALESLLRAGEGDQDAALSALHESLDLAAAGGFIRLYVDLGPKMLALLTRLSASPGLESYVERIRAAFLAEPARAVGDVDSGLLEPLTDRELDVLTLLAKRLANKEIAAQLYLSIETVKRHAANIYGKLRVHSRRAAVERATELGILAG